MNAPAPAVHVPLQNYLKQIEATLKQSFSAHVWVVAELSEFNNRGGTCWFTLVESENGKEVARCSGVMFSSIANLQLRIFEQVTGSQPQAGMKVMLKVCASLHPVHGFKLQVYGIDPNYTLGEMHAKIEQILAKLKEEGIHSKQKALPAPTSFWRIAVISPDQAAGLGDFRREADLLERHGLVTFKYYTALFQGDKAPESIKLAIIDLYKDHEQDPFDVVCIIRGGGAKADLAWLNHHGLARIICRLPIPVFTGIGHERDETVLDHVAHTRFDTPSKVIGSICRHLQVEADELSQAIEKSRRLLEQTIQHEENCLTSLQAKYQRVVQERLSDEALCMNDLENRYERGVDIRLNVASQSLANHQSKAHSSMRELLQQAGDDLRHYQYSFKSLVPVRLSDCDRELASSLQRFGFLAERLMSDATRQLSFDAQMLARQALADVTEEQACLSMLLQRYTAALSAQLQREEDSLRRYEDLYSALDPRSIMAKGFAMIKRPAGLLVKTAGEVREGERVIIEFKDGCVEAVVQ
ncbi:exodeoxyribonuclease VII large subunit [Pseudomonas luteola]|uniref:Exodeoxyribonuclease 7 large subunit n=1 Tax=Pseudomonas luteola TaxID=47886 RepID=A0A2X2EAT8_PSELU|nr:exodeoxyribonuclease VII large subunit [Pseudomonas luteola]MCG7374213.1 exodeoxyribonuclease VII large subunit [Pseudomonas luteola]SPZ05309.1 putative exodeoxyribonuclease VII large subunit [Pseudomonas luteola]